MWSSLSVAELVGWVGVVLCVARLAPQPWHIYRRGRLEGVSAQAIGNNFVSDVGWLLYGLAAGLPPVWVLAALSLPLDVVTLVQVRRGLSAPVVAVTVGWCAVMVLAWFGAGTFALGTLLGFSVVINHGPQVLTALRSADLSGLHPATWWLAIADALLWGGYGLLVIDGFLVAYGVVLGAAATTILVRMSLARRPAAALVAVGAAGAQPPTLPGCE